MPNWCYTDFTVSGPIGRGSLHVQFDTAWSFPLPIFETIVSAFPQVLFEGSAYEPNCDFYIKFKGCNREFACEDDDEARKAAAAEYEEEDKSQRMTA